MRIIGIGHLLFALSVAGLGLLSLGSGDFALNWQPVPKDIPAREALAYLSGAVLLLGGLGLIVKASAKLAAWVLTFDFLLWLVLLQLPKLATGWSHAVSWLGFGETSLFVTGAWALLASLKDDGTQDSATAKLRLARLLFGIATPLIGLSHFVYLKQTVDLVPAYLPHREVFAWFTGAGHIAAGLAVLLGLLPRLAARLEGIMMSLFALMVWAPQVAAHPDSRFLWTAFLVSLAYGASAEVMAETYRGQSWLPRRLSQIQTAEG
ncbi:MAG TPA: DoxX family membrane protein [Rhizomicrobium sp.]|nr:DoxX family membrane protein [Rhizomicrobium sp.]